MRKIDQGKLHALLRRMTKDDLVRLVFRAVKLAKPAELPGLLHGFADVSALSPTVPASKKLLADVRAFHAATVKGDYHDSFDVDSRNFSRMSEGTEAWIEDCLRHFEACRAASDQRSPELVREAFDLLFDLLRRLDRGEECVFFADEGGSWQVGVDWRQLLPAYFRCLAPGCDPAGYATAALRVIKEHADHERPRFLKAARAAGTKEQRKALLLAKSGRAPGSPTPARRR